MSDQNQFKMRHRPAATSRFLRLFAAATLAAMNVAAAESSDFPGAPHVLPDDTLLYLRIDDAEALGESFSDSSLGRMLADPAMRPFASDVYATAAELFEDVGAWLGVSLDELLSIPDGQVAAALCGSRFSEDQIARIDEEMAGEDDDAIRRRLRAKNRLRKGVAGIFLIDAGDRRDRLASVLDRIRDGMASAGFVRRVRRVGDHEIDAMVPPRPGRPPLEVTEIGDVTVIGIGHDTAAFVAARYSEWSNDRPPGEPTLADKSAFVGLVSRCVGQLSTSDDVGGGPADGDASDGSVEETTNASNPSRPQITFFADPQQITRRIVNYRPAGVLLWPLFEQLGVQRISGLAGSQTVGDEFFEAIAHYQIGIDPPRDGFLGVVRPRDVDIGPPTWVFDDVTSYTTIGWRMDVAYRNLGDIIRTFTGGKTLEEAVDDKAAGWLGVSLKDDVLPCLTGRYVSALHLVEPEKLDGQSRVQGLELADRAAAEAAIEKVRRRRPKWFDIETRGGATLYRLTAVPERPETRSTRRYAFTIALIDDWILVADNDRSLDAALSAASGTKGRLIDQFEYELLTSELGALMGSETPFAMSFVRGDEFIRQVYELIQSEGVGGFLAGRSKDSARWSRVSDLMGRHELPAFDQFRQYFAPSGWFAYDEPGGLHITTFTLRAQ